MAKYIAHASIDENGKIAGGQAGDQTKKEVCIRTFYKHPFTKVIRIGTEKVRKQFANNMIDIAKNDNVGYDQNGRNSLLTQAKKVNFDFAKITTKCECDCSSMVTVALLGAIYKVLGKAYYEKALTILVVDGNCATTSTLRSRMSKLSMISTAVYATSAYVDGTSKAVFGDIYIKEGSHVVAYVDDGKKVSVSTTATTGTTTAKKEYYNKYTGSSVKVDEVFKSIGVPSKYIKDESGESWEVRTPVAKANGISNYTGTSAQNTKLINLAKKGKLVKP